MSNKIYWLICYNGNDDNRINGRTDIWASKPDGTYEYKEPVIIAAENPCNGEPFEGDGIVHWITHVTTLPSGGKIYNTNYQVHGTVQDASGNTYSINLNSHYPLVLKEDAANVNFPSETIPVISEGSAPNFLIKSLNKFILNANGEPTVQIDFGETTCVGKGYQGKS